MKDYVLFKKVGRAPEFPIFSCPPDTPDREAIVAAIKQQHIQTALASGSQTPVFSENVPE